ncbi:ralBP1-associated Eps domain-containing protein 1 isoform X2 [Aethina tumida]|uniref:ralBP1-associated Eps domain-containing protein 1 isoform X2 n=1 Tax=Aethina tumida TaxID=116153 RepID=UPI002148C7F2|nr:ralBP1-associated Eps domain-containing protein 1 isoform X2 [Aethina tumida]
MDELHLSDTFQRYFSDVFCVCDEDFSGKASQHKTIELIKSGNVPDEIIAQISEICWNGSTNNYLTRKQFFSALKLVAAYQANMSLKTDLVTQKLDLPLPRFTWNNLETENAVHDLIELRQDEALNSSYSEHVDATSTDSEADSDTLSVVRTDSPEASSAASDSPTPTNSVQDRSWAVTGAWHGLVSEEQRQLLGTEEESSDRHSSDDDTEVTSEVFVITPEQRDYYTKQFRSLQPDTNALLAGPVARTFFEKSRLPVHELRKIWQLADVTKDGALSLQEFNTAMHLVVLRRNFIELPDTLPAALMPGNETPLSVSPETEPILSPQTKDTAKEWTKFVDSPTSSVSSPGPKPVNFDFQKVTLDKDPKLVHPKPLRLTPETAPIQTEDQTDGGTIDMHSPKKFIDSTILSTVSHGVANINLGASGSSSAGGQNSAIQRPQPKKINLPGPGAIPPPPTSACAPEEGGPFSLPAFPPPKKEKPPPPPPRPFKTHGRSSSLDLNRLSKLGAPPTVPPRISPNIQASSSRKLINQRSEGDTAQVELDPDGAGAFANFDQFEKYENVPEGIFPGELYEAERKKLFAQFTSGAEAADDAPRKHGAFEIYRPTAKSKESQTVTAEDKAKWDLFMQLQEENTVLLRMCQELSQELADIKEEKLTLKVRLEKQLNGG